MQDSAPQQVHIVDTDVLVNIRDKYGDSADIWKRVIAEIKAERCKIVRQVFDELERRFPDVYKRLKPYKKKALIPDDIAYSMAVVAEIRAIQTNHPKLYRPLGNNNSADPVIIAVAKEMGAIVVTDEKTSGPKHQSKIPWVCKHRNVGCTNGERFLKAIGCKI